MIRFINDHIHIIAQPTQQIYINMDLVEYTECTSNLLIFK